MTYLNLGEVVQWTGSDQMPYNVSMPQRQHEYNRTSAKGSSLKFQGLSTDSRKIESGEIFLALVGPSFDGHDFLETAVERGAKMLIVNEGHTRISMIQDKYPTSMLINRKCDLNDNDYEDKLIILTVSDTLLALQQIANGYRHTLQAKVIAVTGSVGKTSTREMISCCLSAGGKVHQTYANLNNEIGLPQTLLAASDEDDFIVVEMGMRGLGQIELLSKIACPDISIITNIGWSHIELLETRENILRAKTEIIAGMSREGILIINADDDMLTSWQHSNPLNMHIAQYSMHNIPEDSAEIRIWAENIEAGALMSSFEAVTDKKRLPVKIELPGKHHISNALAGLLTAYILGMDINVAADRIKKYRNTGKRQMIIKLKDICIMDDTYNAAPESMITAVRTISSMAADNRVIAVLAGMRELGNYSRSAHLQVGQAIADAGIAELYLFGEEALDIGEGARSANPDINIISFSDHAVLSKHIKEILRPDDFVLIKGSRAFEMDRITAELEAFLEE